MYKIEGDVSAIVRGRIPEPTAAVGVGFELLAGCMLGCRENHVEMKSQQNGMQIVSCRCVVNNRVRQKELQMK
jgi:hypothetical protein